MRDCSDRVPTMERVAGQHPQAAYISLHNYLQQNWYFLQHATQGLRKNFSQCRRPSGSNVYHPYSKGWWPPCRTGRLTTFQSIITESEFWIPCRPPRATVWHCVWSLDTSSRPYEAALSSAKWTMPKSWGTVAWRSGGGRRMRLGRPCHQCTGEYCRWMPAVSDRDRKRGHGFW